MNLGELSEMGRTTYEFTEAGEVEVERTIFPSVVQLQNGLMKSSLRKGEFLYQLSNQIVKLQCERYESATAKNGRMTSKLVVT